MHKTALISASATAALGIAMLAGAYWWNGHEPAGEPAAGANIGAGVLALFGECFMLLGALILIVWAAAVVIARVRRSGRR
ncbi:hypothetical protein GSY69_06035 [Brevibacterium sp. 5221]|uniref:Uncharacterized protein n=1 Tax=Brevibacterium rongguiense TaxID=2695267 RepID=A0A6N9H6G2_9MICO|nr:hypothetical protein [Brevibacterium rongguiense]MYM19539.1 hypothetical protein [Brevibacterium rongguiense]